MRLNRGMTLVEILAAIGVLVVGMTAIATMLVTSARFGKKALDRNTVAAVISEAVADIERRHLITSSMAVNGSATPFVPPAEEVGLYIETVNSLDVPSIHNPSYGQVTLDGGTHILSKTLEAKFLTAPDKAKIHYAVWPLPTENPKFIGGMGRTVGDLELASGTAIRILYKLERHPDWHEHTFDTNPSSASFGTVTYVPPVISDPINNPEEATNPNSPFRGVYVLTMVVYKQLNRDLSSIEQISEPYVVHLRDKRERN